MNKKGADLRLLLSMLVLVLVLIVAAVLIRNNILNKGDDIAGFTACENLQVGDAECMDSEENCISEGGELAIGGNYDCDGVCCVTDSFIV